MGASTGENLPTRFLRLFFYLLYQPFAWSYDLVAWAVSLGQWKQWIYTTLPFLAGPRVLELGHGPGHLQVAIRNKGMAGFGVDFSRQMGRFAHTKLIRLRHEPFLVRSDARHLPFASRCFDQLVATFPTEYITAPDTLSEVRRLLAVGGSVVLQPVAWIKGADIASRAAAGLFRVTGQAGEWDGRFSATIRRAGFAVEEMRIKLSGAEVMLLVCKPT